MGNEAPNENPEESAEDNKSKPQREIYVDSQGMTHAFTEEELEEFLAGQHNK